MENGQKPKPEDAPKPQEQPKTSEKPEKNIPPPPPEEESQHDYGGLPKRDLKKNLGCG